MTESKFYRTLEDLEKDFSTDSVEYDQAVMLFATGAVGVYVMQKDEAPK